MSGGADSLALLLLASAALPGRVAAATVDHGLRAEAAEEARFVGEVCAGLGVPHAVLAVAVGRGRGPQAAAREARYTALAGWAKREGLAALATAHHVDDQAETLLLRLARGAGLGGLSGVRPTAPFPPSGVRTGSREPRARHGEVDPGSRREGDHRVTVLRPLIGWRRTELAKVVATAGLMPVADPSNVDPRYDRTVARALLRATPWLDPARLAASAAYLAEAEVALAWVAEQAWQRRASEADGILSLDVEDLPAELRRRLALHAFAALGANEPPGPKLATFIAAVAAGGVATLAGVRGEGGSAWRLRRAPPRRGH